MKISEHNVKIRTSNFCDRNTVSHLYVRIKVKARFVIDAHSTHLYHQSRVQ